VVICDDKVDTLLESMLGFFDRGDTIVDGDNEATSQSLDIIDMMLLDTIAVFGPMRKSDRDIFVVEEFAEKIVHDIA
jgi:hypothetical protein